MADAGGRPATLRDCAGPSPRRPRPSLAGSGRSRTPVGACAPSPTCPGPVRPGPRARGGPPARAARPTAAVVEAAVVAAVAGGMGPVEAVDSTARAPEARATVALAAA